MADGLFLYALCGSQRRASSNRLLLQALRDNAPDGVVIEISEAIGDLPIFNPDHEGRATPDSVIAFAEKVGAADGLIVACQEYAHGIPGGLKNALDWLVSREEVPGKPVMIAHASHRGDHVLAQLDEVLRTMSCRMVAEAFLRVPLLGKTAVEQRLVLEEATQRASLSAALTAFTQAIASHASAPASTRQR